MRLEAIAFYSDGPVRGGFIRLDEVTVLTGANDVGKTRILRMIESALRQPEYSDMIDLYGVASDAEVAALIDPETPDRAGIEEEVDWVAEFAAELEPPPLEHGVRLGLTLPRKLEHMSAWRYGRCPSDLGELSEAVQAVLRPTAEPAFEPVKLEYLGSADPELLPEPVVVPSRPGEIQREVGRAVTQLTYVLRELAGYWDSARSGRLFTLDEIEQHRLDAQDPSIESEAFESLRGSETEPSERGPDEPGPDWYEWEPDPQVDRAGELTWQWLVREQPGESRVQPAAVVACRALQDIAAGLLPSFITSDYRLEITPAQPTAISRHERVAIQLMRRDSIENLPDDIELDDDEAFRFDIEDAASGYRVWLELALHEATARGRMLAHILYHAVCCLRLERSEALDVALDDVREVMRTTLRHLLRRLQPEPSPRRPRRRLRPVGSRGAVRSGGGRHSAGRRAFAAGSASHPSSRNSYRRERRSSGREASEREARHADTLHPGLRPAGGLLVGRSDGGRHGRVRR